MSETVPPAPRKNARHPARGPARAMATALLGGAILALSLPAGEAAAQEDPYLKCVDLKKSKRRLECYDTVVKQQHPEVFQKIEEAKKAEQREEFGTPKAPAGSKDAEELKQVDIVIIEFAKNPYGKWLLVTEGGQVWKQVDDFRMNFRGKNIKGRIKKGILGTFFFIPEGKKHGIKVKRIR